MDEAVGVFADVGVYVDRSVERAFENREVAFFDGASFESHLIVAGGESVLGEKDDSAGFPVEPGDQVGALVSEAFAAGADQGRPRAFFRRVADDEGGLVYEDDVVVILNDPRLEFSFGDFPPPVGNRHWFWRAWIAAVKAPGGAQGDGRLGRLKREVMASRKVANSVPFA